MSSLALKTLIFCVLICLNRSQDETTKTTETTLELSSTTGSTAGTENTEVSIEESTEDINPGNTTQKPGETTTSGTTSATTSTTTTTPKPTTESVIPNFNPPNYRYKVLKDYNEDYITPSIFLLIGLIIIILTIAFHYYMESKEKQRQTSVGIRYKPDKKRKETVKSPEKSIPSKSVQNVSQTPNSSPK